MGGGGAPKILSQRTAGMLTGSTFTCTFPYCASTLQMFFRAGPHQAKWPSGGLIFHTVNLLKHRRPHIPFLAPTIRTLCTDSLDSTAAKRVEGDRCPTSNPDKHATAGMRARTHTNKLTQLTYDHQCELEPPFDGLPVHLVGEIGEAHVALQVPLLKGRKKGNKHKKITVKLAARKFRNWIGKGGNVTHRKTARLYINAVNRQGCKQTPEL